jgi:hypothetical protein
MARLAGFDIRIQPRANLVRSDVGTVYGIVATATHDELARLYGHARDVLGELYLPEPVLAETLDGKWRPAQAIGVSQLAARSVRHWAVGRRGGLRL